MGQTDSETVNFLSIAASRSDLFKDARIVGLSTRYACDALVASRHPA
jgi:hypothetical protein